MQQDQPTAASPIQPRIQSAPGQPIRLAILISGGGTTLLNLLDNIDAGKLNATIATVICSNAKSYDAITTKLQGRGLQPNTPDTFPIHKAFRKDHPSTETFSDLIFSHIKDAAADLVCLAGFLSLLTIPDDYMHNVINIHPALLPAFGGKGMHGHHVHTAVLKHGCKLSGCTVHFADPTYDTGPIILQRSCPAYDTDTPDDLAARIFEQECIAFPEAIQLIADRRVTILGRTTQISNS
ncbi:phosphoribosylglycinamide formyltransferase [Poriferisphaera sp. WC338]|uniref:phosphoribosylglycinamide formyltransferase n=1 Tax=Poriferisphaera sp. WC338 TaxID=3425129 RepID=UPI003D813628